MPKGTIRISQRRHEGGLGAFVVPQPLAGVLLTCPLHVLARPARSGCAMPDSFGHDCCPDSV